jgi:hypothetical protein
MQIFESESDAIAAAMENAGGEWQFNTAAQRDYRYKVVTTTKASHNVLLTYAFFANKDISSFWGRYAVVPLAKPVHPKVLYSVDTNRGHDETKMEAYADQRKYVTKQSYWHVNYGAGGFTYIVYDRKELETYDRQLEEYEEKIREAVDSFMYQIQTLRQRKSPKQAMREKWYEEDVLIRRQSTWWEQLLRFFK